MTRQRRVVLDAVRRMGSHPSADEVYGVVRQQLPHISLGTVYRTLAVLSEVGLVRELHLAGQAKRFDGDLEGHSHVRCSGCGQIADVGLGALELLSEAVRPLTDYEVTGCHLEFAGICPECRSGVTEEKTDNGGPGPAGGPSSSGRTPTQADGSPTPPRED